MKSFKPISSFSPIIQSSLKKFFKKLKSISPLPINNKGNIYELYLYSKVYIAISRSINIKELKAKTIDKKKFRFKCSPGPVNNCYSYFEILTKGGNSLELRNGVEVQGYALDHEVDICVFSSSPLKDGIKPLHLNLKLAIECKYYSVTSSLKGEARKNLGAISDFSINSKNLGRSSKSAGCVHFGLNFYTALTTNIVANSQSRLFIEDYLKAYGLNPIFDLMPGSLGEKTLVKKVRALTTTW